MSFSPSYRPEGQWDCPWQDVSSSAQPCWGQVSSFEEPDGSYRTCSGHEAVAMGGGAYLPEPAVNYSSDVTPPDYVCKECGAVGVRLYRPYNTMLDAVTLRCTSCARANQSETDYDPKHPHSIGWLVAAVPTAENDTFWGYISVPEPGVQWWDRLPIEAK